MKAAYALYELEADHSLSVTSPALKRKGALLKLDFDSNLIGYADCHPWPELGDLTLEQQLSNLSQGELTPLTRCALELAFLDAKNRIQGKNIFVHCNVPRSHFLITNIFNWTPHHIQQIIQQGYTHIKLKLGRHIDHEIEYLYSLFLHTPLKLRLDFNENLVPDILRYFLKEIQSLKNSIDFIEDPFPFDPQEWALFQREGWTLACDRKVEEATYQPQAAKVLIIKPMLQPFKEWQKRNTLQTRIVTSYLGHPIEQTAAAYVAAQIDPFGSFVHGLLSHHAYQPTCFSQYLNWHSPCFIFPPGLGFGFDQELVQLEWIPLELLNSYEYELVVGKL